MAVKISDKQIHSSTAIAKEKKVIKWSLKKSLNKILQHLFHILKS